MRWSDIFFRALERPKRRWLKFFADIVVDLALINAALYISLRLALVHRPYIDADQTFLLIAPIISIAAVLTLFCFGFYWLNGRYVGMRDFLHMVLAGTVIALCFEITALVTEPLKSAGIPSIPVMFGFMTIGAVASTRFAQRVYSYRFVNGQHVEGMKSTLVIGAGDAGESLIREVMRARHPRHHIIGFIDDDPAKLGMRVHGLAVLGNVQDIPRVAAAYGVQEVLVAVPSADGKTMRRIMEASRQAGLSARTLPSLSALLSEDGLLSTQLREFDIEDLIRRRTVKADINDIGSYLKGKSVMITGGGGSIGSELARQIASIGTARLCILGRGENSVFEIEQELSTTRGFFAIPQIVDVRNSASLNRAFKAIRPDVVFHAAAHKHVPLMQGNPIEAIENNVFGTLNAMEAAVASKVSKFILVSTDKAVNPSSVMGATKRVCELLAADFAQRSNTEFSVVRFGNVLGSRGSVVPLLKEQIRRGGPVRLTDPEMERYFMTISEAAQLIVQAGAMGGKGDLFILDMGEPIKLKDLAYDLISLYGLVPEQDIKVEYFGARPGEKLKEELTYDRENLLPTSNEKIGLIPAEPVDHARLLQNLESLHLLCESQDEAGAQALLMEMAAAGPGTAVVQIMERISATP